MYILFKSVNESIQRTVQTYGHYINYTIGYIPDTHADILDFQQLNPTVLDDEVAKAWKFIGEYREYTSVKDNTVQQEQLELVASMEANSYKQQYFLTVEDRANTVKCHQAIMRKMLDEVYDKRFIAMNAEVSHLESGSWPQQRIEADLYAADNSALCPLLTALSEARGITLAEMVTKVNEGVAAYTAKVQDLLSRKQLVETEIKACNSIADCNRLFHNRYDYQMPIQQMIDELGTNENSTFNL